MHNKPSQILLHLLRCDSLIQSVSLFLPQRSHAQTIRDSTSSYKIDYLIIIKNFLNPEGHHNPFSGSKVTAILLKEWIWPIGEVASGSTLSWHETECR